MAGVIVRTVLFRLILTSSLRTSTNLSFTGLHRRTRIEKDISLWKRGYNHIVVSADNPRIALSDMQRLLVDHNIEFVEGFTCIAMDCHFCSPTKRQVPGKIFVNMTTGGFLCLKCCGGGSWIDLTAMLALRKTGVKKVSVPSSEWVTYSKEAEELFQVYDLASPLESLDAEESASIISKFNLEFLDVAVFKKFEARISLDRDRLLLPIHSISGRRVGMHLITWNENALESNVVEAVPKNLDGVLFGWKQLRRFQKQENISIVRSPLDVMVLAQEKTCLAVSLPDPKSLPLDVLPLLESFSRITLWLGNNLDGRESARLFAPKLNQSRCHVVSFYPGPLEAKKKGLKLAVILKSAAPVLHKAITTFRSLRKDVFTEFSEIQRVSGVQVNPKGGFRDELNFIIPKVKKYHSHRKGEFTLLTGQTGSGKTTFISEYSLDLCMQGVRTLWGSFEVRNPRLIKTMLLQFSLTNLGEDLEQFDYYADRFEQLPLYFLTFHGPQSFEGVLDAMKHAIYVHDIEHVVVDNLQFMMGITETNKMFDRFWKQDVIVSALRQFATFHNCHVTLVIHPRKELSDILTNTSIYGGAMVGQEADNVLILQAKRLHGIGTRKFVQVTKNRFDGEIGIVPLEFDKATRSYAGKPNPWRKVQRLAAKPALIGSSTDAQS